MFEHCCVVWRPVSQAQISKFEAIQRRAVKWIDGKYFEHYSDEEYVIKLHEMNILPLNLKFALHDLIIYYKIIHSMIPLELPDAFTVIEPGELRCTLEILPQL